MYSQQQVRRGLKALWLVYIVGLVGFVALGTRIDEFHVDLPLAALIAAFLLFVTGSIYYQRNDA